MGLPGGAALPCAMLLLLLGCSDYAIQGKEESPPPFEDPGDSAPDPVDDTGEPPPVEDCNGVDDDGDGLVDEGYGDVDGDGVADCLDQACALELLPAGTSPPSEACSGTATVTDPWSAVANNAWTALSTDSTIESIAQTPIVMQLTDDDGDGLVTAADQLDVAFLAWANRGSSAAAHLVVLDGATFAEHLDLPDHYFAGEMAAGDIDGDGAPELVAYDGRNALHAYEMDGTEIWSTGTMTAYLGGQPSVAIVDLEGDGAVEVLAQEAILDGADGSLLATLPARGASFSYTQHVVADLDLDGRGEIVYDGDVHDASGALLWEGLPPGLGSMSHAMVVDVDGDPEGEVVMASDLELAIYDTDGTELATARFGGGAASVPCAADFDGDGQVEVAVPAQTFLRVVEVDGSERAALPITDTSTMAGCVAADLDGDGAAELIHADELALTVWDVRTGSALMTWTEHASGTLVETPALADLDADGAVEILLGSNDNMGRGTWIGLTVIQHDGGGWTAGPPDWPANARVDGRFGPGGVVAEVGTWWERENTFRGVSLGTTPVLRDAAVDLDDVCVASCDPGGAARVSVQAYNPGRDPLPADAELRLYRVDGGARTLVASQPLGAELPSGASAASAVFEVTSEDYGAEGFVVTLGEGESDCHPEDNEASWSEPSPCP